MRLRSPQKARSRRRFRGPVALLAAVLGVGLVAGLLASGAGPDIPGLKLREWLGLSDPAVTGFTGCDFHPSQVRSPATPQPAPGEWRVERPSPLARAELAGAFVDGKVYLLGGQGPTGASQDTVLTYEPRTGAYGRAPDMPVRLDHTNAVEYRGSLYVVGGNTDSEAQAGLWRYSPETRRWTELSSMRVPRGGSAAAVIGDRLYVATGSEPAFPNEYVEPYRTLEIYDFATDTWEAGPDLPTGRHHTSAAVVDGKMYVVGGRTPSDFSTDAVERFDPETDRWERMPPLPLGTGGSKAVAVNGELVVTGGDEEEGWRDAPDETWVTPAVFAFQPERGRWRRLPDMNRARHLHSAVLVDRRLYVFEGSPCPGFDRMDHVESFAPRRAG